MFGVYVGVGSKLLMSRDFSYLNEYITEIVPRGMWKVGRGWPLVIFQNSHDPICLFSTLAWTDRA